MNPIDFGDRLTFHVAAPAGQTLHLSSEIAQSTTWITTNIFTDLLGPQIMYPNNVGDPLFL